MTIYICNHCGRTFKKHWWTRWRIVNNRIYCRPKCAKDAKEAKEKIVMVSFA